MSVNALLTTAFRRDSRFRLRLSLGSPSLGLDGGCGGAPQSCCQRNEYRNFLAMPGLDLTNKGASPCLPSPCLPASPFCSSPPCLLCFSLQAAAHRTRFVVVRGPSRLSVHSHLARWILLRCSRVLCSP